jgi:hypothetical protein
METFPKAWRRRQSKRKKVARGDFLPQNESSVIHRNKMIKRFLTPPSLVKSAILGPDRNRLKNQQLGNAAAAMQNREDR